MEKGKILPLLILPVIWGSYYVASQKIIGYTSAFTAGVGIRFITMIFLTVIMYRRSELQKLTNTKAVALYALLVCTDSAIQNKSLRIGLYSIAASFIQLIGYGTGFWRAWWNRCILGKDEFEAFKKNFYK